MADDLEFVQPGQLITADLLNAIIARVQGISVGDGKVDVPLLFNRTLADAIAIIKTPGSNVQLGLILDAGGATVSPTDSTKFGLKVIGQMPPPGVRVTEGAGMNLLIATAPAGTVPDVQPKISGFAQAQAVGQVIQIIGTNFDSTASNNKVSFNGHAAGAPQANSTRQSLFVLVPEGADAAPQPAKVRIELPSGLFAESNVPISASTGAKLPKITALNGVDSGTAASEGDKDLVITGSDFGTDAAQVKVTLGDPGVAGVPTLKPKGSVTATSITVHIPPLIQIAGAFQVSRPVVTVGTVVGPASPVVLALV